MMNNCLITILSGCLLVKSPTVQVREWQQGVVPTFVLPKGNNSTVVPIINWQLKKHTTDNLEGSFGVIIK